MELTEKILKYRLISENVELLTQTEIRERLISEIGEPVELIKYTLERIITFELPNKNKNVIPNNSNYPKYYVYKIKYRFI